MENRFLMDIGVMLGRSMSYIFCSKDTIVMIAIMPIVFILLLVYVFGCAILLMLEMNSNISEV